MKNILKSMLLVLLVTGLWACSNDQEDRESQSSKENPLDIALLVGGLGDMSFADSAHEGIQAAQEAHGEQIKAEVIEFGYDYSVVENYLLDAAEEKDIIIMPSQFVEAVAQHAPSYPETKFWLYGTTFPFEEGEYDNVYAMNYRSNEASYLAGYLSASKEDSGHLGFLGGIDNNVINDFWYGYVQGAQAAHPDIRILTNYVGSFDDTVKGKELSLAMYQAGATTIFNVAGPVGIGLAEAAIEEDSQGVDMIGVDSDQAALFESQNREDLAAVVSTSVLTNVGPTLERALELELAGELVYGEVESLGLKEGAVGIAINNNYEAAYSEQQKEELEKIVDQIIVGEIVIESVYDLETDLDVIRDQTAP